MFHIAQINIGRIKAPLDDAIMAGFVGRLDEINALADQDFFNRDTVCRSCTSFNSDGPITEKGSK